MEQLKKQRSAAKSRTTRTSNTLKELLAEGNNTSAVVLEDAADQFDTRIAELDRIQAEIELELEEEEIENEVNAAEIFRNNCRKYRINATQRLIELGKNDDTGSVHSNTSAVNQQKVRLPKLELPPYAGENTNWQSFWDQFEAHVHKSDMSDISKFSHLLSLLKGEAKAVVKGIAFTALNYDVAVKLLTDRYGRKELIIFSHIQALLNCNFEAKGKGKSYIATLWSLYDEVLTHIRSLEVLGVGGKQCEVFLTPIILTRLPKPLRLEWSRTGAGKECDLDFLLEFLKKEIERHERSETFNAIDPIKDTQEHERKKASNVHHTPTAAALHTSSGGGAGPKCVFCDLRHYSDNCYAVINLGYDERVKKILSLNLCFKCLRKGHSGKDCRSSFRCKQCNGKHSFLMCKEYKPQNGSGGATHYFNSSSMPSSGGSASNFSSSSGPIQSQFNNAATSHYSQGSAFPPTSGQPPVYFPHPPVSQTPAGQQMSSASSSSVHLGVSLANFSRSCTILQSANIPMMAKDGTRVIAKVLFDTGADRSYITSNFNKKINAKCVGSEFLSYTSFGGGKSSRELRKIVEVNLIDLNHVKHQMNALVIPSICEQIVRPSVPVSLLNKFSHLNLADNYVENCKFDIDAIIGIDMFWRFMLPQIFRVDGLVAQNSLFGWILNGSYHLEGLMDRASTILLSVNRITDDDIHQFWSLESQGICDDVSMDNHLEHDKVWKNFSENVKFDKRYEVSLPWKAIEGKGKLINNLGLTTKRLFNMHKKYENDPEFLGKYYSVFQKYESNEQIQEVPSDEIVSKNPTYYMPHRPVLKESSITTKIRPVFDASAPSYNNISLNDLLDTGPPLNPDIVEILIRFRRWPIAMTSDITKAFLQISVNKRDRDVHRFLLLAKVDGKMIVRHMRFTRLPFGNTASPFLLNATIRHHLAFFPESPLIKELKDNMFVDNWLSGADSLEEAYFNHTTACGIFGQAAMPLTQWNSNSKTLSSKFSDLAEFDDDKSDMVSVLGMAWIPSLDHFTFESFSTSNIEIVSTKRAVLSVIARLFDPLGFLSPFVMYAKILFQDCWRLGIDWNDPLPTDLDQKWQVWIDSSKTLKDFKFDRAYFEGCKWGSLTNIEVHGFGDASEKGYGCVVYLKIWDPQQGVFKTSFVAAKSRVAPIKKITLPRLELLAALITARFVKFVIKSLRLRNDVPYYCWSDSKVTLAWIKGNPYNWKMFVANRVVEIQNLTSPSNWFFCPGTDNPADLITRGLLVDKLLSNPLWLRGPPWLSKKLSYNSQNFSANCPDEREDLSSVHLSISLSNINLETWSSFTKAQRIFAWILRFFHNCRNRTRVQGPISHDELTLAKDKLFICAQVNCFPREIEALRCSKSLPKGSPLFRLDPFLDAKNLLRAKGRLENAEISYESKYPIILPKGNFSKIFVSLQHLVMKHAGVNVLITNVRFNYFIIGIRKLAKKVCRECIYCKRFDSRPCNQPSAPLPSFRVTAAPPFSIVGLDFAGPLYCSDFPTSKFYLLLFTCSVIRGVHLEITDSLSLPDCVLAVRRFIARRGLPSTIYSDNATTFKGFNKQLVGIFGHLAPKWKFIVPISPWWGGWWERLIRSVKSSLKKSVGINCLTRCELETTVHEIEACINSRPLTFASGEIEHGNPLTPAHFLIGRPFLVQIPIEETNVAITGKDLRERETKRLAVLDTFWSIWSNNYILNLPHIVKGFSSNCKLKKGSMVLVRENNIPRMTWPLGIIVNVFPGKDGIIRSVEVKTAKGVFTRSIQRLHDLEIDSDFPSEENIVNQPEPTLVEQPIEHVPENVTNENVPENNVDDKGYTTRSGRTVKVPHKLDI